MKSIQQTIALVVIAVINTSAVSPALAHQSAELFTKQSLGLDLATVQFSMTAGTNYAHADAPVSPPPLTALESTPTAPRVY
jgi:hypothetical protein